MDYLLQRPMKEVEAGVIALRGLLEVPNPNKPLPEPEQKELTEPLKKGKG